MKIVELKGRIDSLNKDNGALASQAAGSPLGSVPTLALTCTKRAMTIARAIERNGLEESSLFTVLSAVSYASALVDQSQDAVTKALNVLRQWGAASSEARSHSDSIRTRYEKVTQDLNDKYELSVSAFIDALEVADSRINDQELEDRRASLDIVEQRMNEVIAAAERSEAKFLETIGRKVVDDSIGTFSARADQHTKMETTWGKRAAGVAAGAAVYTIWFFARPIPEDQFRLGKFIAENLLALTAFTALLRLSIRRWNLERNLAVLYAHRVAALNHYRTLSDSIPEAEADTRGTLRLQVMQMIYSDPATGYREESASDISITPAVTVLDRIGKTSA
jgi:hypothetical protein